MSRIRLLRTEAFEVFHTQAYEVRNLESQNQIITNKGLEIAYKTILDLILKYEKGTFTGEDSLELVYWTTSCSFVYGKVPSLAQSAYNYIFRESHVFNEDCPANLPKNMEIGTGSKNVELQLHVFPNPNNGVLYVRTNLENLTEAHCTINSLEGRQIYEGIIDFSKGLELFKFGLANGVYIIKIDTANELFYQQFVYTK